MRVAITSSGPFQELPQAAEHHWIGPLGAQPQLHGGEPLGEGRKHKPGNLVSELPESKWVGRDGAWGTTARFGRVQRTPRVTRTRGTRRQPAHPSGASTRRTAGTPFSTSSLISERRPPRAPVRRFAHARTIAFEKRVPDARSSHSVYQTSASARAPST